MALPATEAFTAASDAALQTYSANWTISAGAFTVLAASDTVHPASNGAESGAFWNADTFNANQYAQIALANISASNAAIGVVVRCSAGGNYYGLYYAHGYGSTGMVFLFKMVSNAFTTIAEYIGTGAWSNGDVLRLEVNGTTLTPLRNGNLITQLGTKTDASLSSGAAGICGYDTDANMRADNWEAGNLGGGAVDIPIAILRPRRRVYTIDSWR